MRKFLSFLGILFLFSFVNGYLWASNADSPGYNVSKMKRFSFVEKNPEISLPSITGKDLVLKETSVTDSISPVLTEKQDKRWTSDDLTGEYIHFFRTALSGDVDRGGKIIVYKSPSNPNELVVTGFCAVDEPVLEFRMFFDPETQTISFPTQTVLVQNEKYYGIDFAGATSELKPDRKACFESRIDENGTFGFSGLFGLFVNDGIYMNQPLWVFSSLYFARPNGSLSCKVPGENNSEISIDEPVFIWKYSDNDIMVENFFNNGGKPVRIKLNNDRSATIRPQLAFVNSMGRCYTGAGKWENGKLVSYSKTIVTPENQSNNVIDWTDWMLTITNGDQMNYVGPITDTKLRINEGTFDYPNIGIRSFVGEGTEDSPYLIRNATDLRFLSCRVTETFDDNANCAKAFSGKYFRVENDIDLSDVELLPIGNSASSFNGIFDGGNHTISNLNQTISGRNYVGLFGHADENSILKNVVLKDPVVVSNGIYVGALAGFAKGSIENCKIISPKLLTTAYGIGGVAGISYSVRDSKVENGQIFSAKGYVGGITAQCNSSLIANCQVSETNISTAGLGSETNVPAGGVVGLLNEGSVEDCFYTGLLNCNELYYPMSIGGIAGQVKNGVIKRSFFSGHISAPALSSSSNIGGLAGALGGTLSDSYSSGRLDAPICTHAGGLTGYVISTTEMPTKVSNCYTAVSLNVKTFKYDVEKEVRETLGTIAETATPEVQNIYFDSNITNFYSKTYSAGTTTLSNGQLPAGFNIEDWTLTEGQYPRLKSTYDTEDAKFSATAYVFEENNNISRVEKEVKINLLGATKAQFFLSPDKFDSNGHFAKINESNIIIPGTENGKDTLFISNGNRAFYHVVAVLPNMYEGNGTMESPYLIKTKDQLINLSEATTDNGQKYTDVYFSIVNDIDMEYDYRFKGISSGGANSFDGVLDGNGHTIHNLYLNGVTWSVKPEDSETGLGTGDSGKSKIDYGFVGKLGKTGILRNLSIADDADISLWSTSGAFVGENSGLVENCKNYALIKAYFSWCGCIVGDNMATGVIRGCFNAGDLKGGNMQSGGIAGQNRGFIEESMNVGNIELKQLITNTAATSYYCVGGIAGRMYGGDVKNVVNAGAISGNKQIGGITGSLTAAPTNAVGTHSVLGAVSYGPVYAVDAVKVGGIGGDTGTKSTTSVAYYDIQLAPYLANGSAALTGVEGLSTSRLISGEKLSGLDEEIWQFDPGMYPTLKRFATESLAQNARRMIFDIKDNISIKDLSSDVVLSSDNELQYKLALDTAFSIQNGKLIIPVGPKEFTTDTLTISRGKLAKPLVVSVYPVFPLDGEGTATAPYLIQNAADWNNLAGYTLLKPDVYAGKCFAITSDLDFNNTTITPFATNKDLPFQGKIDGRNHSMKGYDYVAPANQTYTGLIGYMGVGSEVSNLVLEGRISATGTYLGGLVASLAGKLENVALKGTVSGNKADIGGLAATVLGTGQMVNCSNRGTVESTATSSINYIGGLVADVKADAKFINCKNEGTVKAVKAQYVGGLIALAEAVTIKDCVNDGEILFGDASVAQYVGGILASAKNAVKEKTYEISGCVNNGNISAKCEVAGIVGSVGNTTVGNVILNISDCENKGDITSLSTSASYGVAAGIAGKYTAGSTITNCVNSGKISANGGKSIGGILGVKANNSNATYPILVSDCRNNGTIVSKGYHVSGIMGGEMCAVTIDNCYNSADITAAQYMVGGIASYTTVKGSEIQNCFNTGNITTDQSMAGGILGASTAQVDIIDCWNSGNILSTNTKADVATTASNNIGGIAGKGGGLISYCHNTGKITGLVQTAGLVGLPLKDITNFDNCYNAGVINSTEDKCGAIVGIDTSVAGLNWAEKNTVEKTYFVSEFVNSSLATVGTPIDFASLLKLNIGDGWHSADDYTLPLSMSHKNNEAAHVVAAQVVAPDGGNLSAINDDFYVGKPGNVVWSSDADLTFEGNKVKLGNKCGKIILTVKSGEYSKNVEINVLEGSSVSDLEQGKTISEAIYYTMDGIEVVPSKSDGQLYIVKVIYTDGSKSVFKYLNK